jgi:type IV pilus assembly protein PilC
MAKFSYTAINAAGKNKKGMIEANTLKAATNTLKENGFYTLSISEQGALQKELVLGNPVKTKDLTIFCQQFEAILSAGVSVLEALNLLKEQTENKHLTRLLEDIYVRVERGEPLSASMKANGKYFPSILINMIEAGEASGSLEIALKRMAVHFEKEHALKQLVKKATTYPMVVSIVAVIVVSILIVFVVPTFVGMFSEMGADLPGTTKALIAISDFAISRWYIIILTIVAIVVGYSYYASTDVGAISLSRLKLKLPIFGDVERKIVASRFSRTLSTLLASGLPLLDALGIVAKVVGNVVAEKGLINAQEQVSKGIPLSKPITDMGVFPPMITHMVKIGEETGQLEPILNKVADFYDGEVESAVTQMTTMLEPAIIVVLGVVISFVIISILQPMFGMYDLVQ